tara:strand:- start:9 stop:842 length:834 start_codon:yes stop_codon:yes gene_type:complete
MTSQSPRIYIYKITFEEVLYYYYGVHKEKRYNEYYMGSPMTHKWMWDFYTPKKQILELFEFSDKGWLEAQEIEKRIIKPVYNTDKWCLNENCGGIFSIQHQSNAGKIGGKKGGKIGGKKAKKLGVGIHGRTKDQMTEDGIKGGKKVKELGVGIHGRTKEQMSEDGKNAGKIGGKKSKELGLGAHGRTKDQMTEDGKKGGKIGGKKSKELGLGFHGLTPEQKSENARKGGKIGGKKGGKKTNSQKWKCIETGYVSNPGALTNYQRNRGIDTSKRKRIS